MSKDKALKLALEALETCYSSETSMYRNFDKEKADNAIAAIKEALAQPEQCRKEQRGNGEYVCNCKSGECPELAQPELCKYGQEPKSCTSSPMDCQCALDATFAQPEQEPVAWITQKGKGWLRWHKSDDNNTDSVPLYTTPPQRKPLTDEQINTIWHNSNPTNFEARSFARAIEAAHGIKE